ncbi:hypothetical protein [Plantactinospora sp. BC1]|uniref:hypothetical protein n=1 Tax=Plantactinospora sp. BC1 TaxID=2108470 RepID=UPI00131F13D9|nr:hypothetical protein [Plantactinospora sp. BC1]
MIADRFGDPAAVLILKVFLDYASKHGHTLIDRRVCLPVLWTDDRDRCRVRRIKSPPC